jgi:hypothetical protein
MTHHFMLTLVSGVVRALLACASGEVLRLTIHHTAPAVPGLACVAISLILGVLFVEMAWCAAIVIYARISKQNSNAGEVAKSDQPADDDSADA